MKPWLTALVIAACAFAASLGWLFGMTGVDPLRAGANAASRQQVHQACLDEADKLTEGAESYADYEGRVAWAIEARSECERLYGSVVREGTVEAQGWEER